MEERLKKFAAIVDAGSFTAAAESLHTSQPALSTAVQKLERELKTPLLERGSHTPTEAGKIAYRYGKFLGAHGQNLRLELDTLLARRPQVALGMLESVAEVAYLKLDTLAALADTIEANVTIQGSEQLINQLEVGSLDIVLSVARNEYVATVRTYRLLGDEPFVLICAPQRATSASAEMQFGELRRFIAYGSGYTNHLISRTAQAQGITLQTILRANGHIAKQLVLQDRGVAILPYSHVAPELVDGELVALPLGGQYLVPRPIAALTRQHMLMPQAIDEVLGQVKQSLHKLTTEALEQVRQ